MGTRADFYVGRGKSAEWVASVAWDGYPAGITIGDRSSLPGENPLFLATTEEEYRKRLEEYLAPRKDVTRPADGWPWPWDDSNTTDYAYTFDNGKVWACPFGHGWFDPLLPEPRDPNDLEEGEENTTSYTGDPVQFPDMSDQKNMTFGPRSGLIVMGL